MSNTCTIVLLLFLKFITILLEEDYIIMFRNKNEYLIK